MLSFTFNKVAFVKALLLGCLSLSVSQAQTSNPAANTLPTGGQVAAGSANIATSGNTMTVTQTSQRAVVNWNGFDVGSNARVDFKQPNANASTLNRVTGATPSMINGAVNANGQVIFVNPNGIVFGAGAEVNAGAVIATTMNVTDAEYMSGSNALQFKGNGQGQVINQGKIKVSDLKGYIALMAPQVINEGVILANLSGANSVALVAGQSVTVTFGGNQLININVDASTINALISNKRLIKTEGGQIIIAANSVSDLKASVINNTGTISASAISTSGGKISLRGDTINQAGTISANGGLAAKSSTVKTPQVVEKTANGGQITLQGNTVNVKAGSTTSAKGAANGGTINVGTTEVTYTQNADGSRSNVVAKDLAKTVTVEAGATLDVSSVNQGNGGEINVWSSQQTTVAGTFLAQGGQFGGNGGFVETSSVGQLTIAASVSVDTSAPLGKKGNWLLDPEGMVIDASTAAAISTALETANVTVAVVGDLTVASDAQISSGNTNNASTLTLNASGSLNNNGSLNLGQSGSLVLNANAVNLNSGSVTSANQVTATAQTISATGSVTSSGGSSGGVNLLGGTVVVAGNVSANGTGSSSGSGSSSSGSGSSGSGSSGSGSSGSGSSGSGSSGSSTSGSGRSSSSTQSNTVTGRSASGTVPAVTPTSAEQLLATITAAKAAAATSAALASTAASTAAATSASSVAASTTTVVNISAANMTTSLNAAIASARAAAATGTTTYINVAAGTVAGNAQAAMSIAIAPNAAVTSGATTTASTATTTTLASGGTVNIQAAQSLTIIAGSSISANAASVSSATTPASASTPAAGSVKLVAYSGPVSVAGSVTANSTSSQGGTVAIAANDVSFNGATVQANGTIGGAVHVTATSGSANLMNTALAVNGSVGTGGKIQVAGQTQTQFVASTVSANGVTAGGEIQLGIHSSTNNTTISGTTSLDSQTVITANAEPSSSASTSASAPSQGGEIYIAGSVSLNTAAHIQANADIGGLIILSSPAGTYQNTGYIQTNGSAGVGGTIAQSGLISTTLTGATLEANGTTGGGNILTGRDFQANPLPDSATIALNLPLLSTAISVPTSQLTVIDSNSTLTANALNRGDGGNVMNWGDNLAALGRFNAQAQGESGNGGLIETSGHQLILTGIVTNAAARNGSAGVWLLDPYDVTIAADDAATSGTTYSTTFVAGATSTILASQISASLNAGTSVSISTGSATSNTIYVNSAIYATTGSANLTLIGGTINIAADIRTGGAQSYTGNTINLGANNTAGGLLSYNGRVVVSSGSSITLTSGQAFSSFTSATVEGELTLNGGFILGAMAGAGTVNLAQGTHRLNFLNAWAVTGQLNILSTGIVDIYNSGYGSQNTIRHLKVDGTLDLRSQSISIGSLTGNGNIKNTRWAGLSQLTVGAHNQSSIFAGTITEPADTISLVKTGSGTFTLTGANKYTGRTTVSAGTLEIGGNGSLSADQSGSGTYNQDITVLAGATFRYSSAFAQTLTYIEGAGSLDLAPTTTINIGQIGVTGNVNVLTGNVLVGGFGIQGSQTRHPTLGWLFNWSGNLTLNASSVLQLSQADYSSNPLWTQQLSGILSGTGSLLKMNAKQTLLLTGENTYTGNISVEAGALRIGGTGYIGSGNYTGSVSLAADTQLDFSSSAEQTISGSITGAGAVSVSAGRLSLTGANSYAGDTSISGGALFVNSGGATGSNLSTGAVTLSGGALVATSTTTISNRIILAQGNSALAASSGHTAKFSGIISGLGSVLVGDAVNNGTVVFANANTYSGGTTIDAGSLRADSASAFGSGSILVAAGATLDLHGQNIEDAGVLTLNGAGLNGAGALTNSALTESTYSNDIVLGSTTAIGSSTAGIRLNGMVSDTDGFGLALVGTQAITLNNTNNALSLIASGSSLGALSVTNAEALEIGSITLAGTTYNGLSSTDRISIKTLTGSLFISQSVSTSSSSAVASAPALLLAAGSNTLPSNTTDNIVLSDAPILSVGSGGMADFYSGASAGSLGLDASVATKTPNSTVYGYTISYQPSAPGYNIVYRTQSNNTSVSSTTDTDIATSHNRTSSMASSSQYWDSLSANNGALNPTSGTETKSNGVTSDAAPFRSACVLQTQVLSPDQMLKSTFVAHDHNLSCRIVGSGRTGGYLN